MKAKEIADAASAAASITGINARHYEKDFYVTQALRAVVEELGDEVVFKGGTSLSKAYGLIDRFSEDIDLLIVPSVDEASHTESLFDRMTKAAQAVIPKSEPSVSEAVTGLMRDVRLVPSYATKNAVGVMKAVRLEAGRRGGPTPVEVRPVETMLGDTLTGLSGPEFHPFDVTVLHPARTLVEKFAAVSGHAGKVRSAGDMTGRHARHFYDIYQLLDADSPAVTWLTEGGDVTGIVRDCESVTRRWYDANEPYFIGSLADADVFTDVDIQVILEAAYDRTCKELCSPRAIVPSWAEVRERVEGSKELLTVLETANETATKDHHV